MDQTILIPLGSVCFSALTWFFHRLISQVDENIKELWGKHSGLIERIHQAENEANEHAIRISILERKFDG